jgi:hypothetical protein
VAIDWSMPRRGDACVACGRVFEPGEPFQACLYETDAGYERRDFCQTCPPADERPVVAAWRTRRPPPSAPRVQPFDREAVYAFFERLSDAAEPQQLQFRFVLALLLWRKKVLRLERTLTEPAGEVWEFSVPRTGAVHGVVRPALEEAELERLSGQLEQLLADPGQAAGPLPPAAEETHA